MMRDKKKAIFILLFSLLGLITLQIPVSKIVGSSQSFSLFDFFAPITGLFLNSIPGATSVLIVKVFDLIFVKKTIDLVSLLRLLPLPLAAYYFGSQSKKKSIIAVICIVLFVAHPIGRQAWNYSLYWLIPILASLFPKRLFLKSLGSTFTAHAVGSTVFLYAFQLTPTIWKGLIPLVFVERVSFALGIWASCFIFNLGLNFLVKWLRLKKIKSLVQKEYLPSKEFLLKFT